MIFYLRVDEDRLMACCGFPVPRRVVIRHDDLRVERRKTGQYKFCDVTRPALCPELDLQNWFSERPHLGSRLEAVGIEITDIAGMDDDGWWRR